MHLLVLLARPFRIARSSSGASKTLPKGIVNGLRDRARDKIDSRTPAFFKGFYETVKVTSFNSQDLSTHPDPFSQCHRSAESCGELRAFQALGCRQKIGFGPYETAGPIAAGQVRAKWRLHRLRGSWSHPHGEHRSERMAIRPCQVDLQYRSHDSRPDRSRRQEKVERDDAHNNRRN